MGQFVQGGNFGCLMSFKKGEDDFPFFGSFLAHLEPELELFGVWAISSGLVTLRLYFQKKGKGH